MRIVTFGGEGEALQNARDVHIGRPGRTVLANGEFA